MVNNTHYPSYDVMRERTEWDDHTRTIVEKRLVPASDYKVLTDVEAEILRSVCSLLVDDDRGEIVQWILAHIDDTLTRGVGEGQRKSGVPPAKELIGSGLRSLQNCALARFAQSFMQLNNALQLNLIEELSQARLQPAALWGSIPQKALFEKLLNLSVEAYYSHPSVWSEMGYGGPAYPRGYVRTAIGQLDPWEARKDD